MSTADAAKVDDVQREQPGGADRRDGDRAEREAGEDGQLADCPEQRPADREEVGREQVGEARGAGAGEDRRDDAGQEQETQQSADRQVRDQHQRRCRGR